MIAFPFTVATLLSVVSLFTAPSAQAELPRASSYDVVVLGAGPAGLAAALAAEKQGLKVLIVEKRLHPEMIEDTKTGKNPWGSRTRNVAIDVGAIETLKKLGVEYLPHTHVEAYRLFDGVADNGQRLSRTQFTKTLTQAAIGRQIGGVTSIADIESTLYKTALQRGIEFAFGAEVEPRAGEKIAVKSSSSAGVATEAASSLISAEHVVIAEGAHSTTLKSLGIERGALGFPTSRWAVANFSNPRGAIHEIHSGLNPDASFPFFSLALPHGDKVTVYISPLSDQPFSEDLNQLLEKAAERIQIKGARLENAISFNNEIDQSKSFSAKGRFLVVGDAARKADPGSGFGITSAIYDSDRVAKYLSEARDVRLSRDRVAKLEALKRFEGTMQESVDLVSRQASYFHGLRRTIQSTWLRRPMGMGLQLIEIFNVWLFGATPNEDLEKALKPARPLRPGARLRCVEIFG